MSEQLEPMVGFTAAPSDLSDFAQLLAEQAYLQAALEAMGMTWSQLIETARTTGILELVTVDGAPAGYCWTELRGRVLHLHALVLHLSQRNKGVGSRVLRLLAERYQPRAGTLELGVHRSNTAARRLYERAGFHVVRVLDDLGFQILQLDLRQGS